jgi:hypothetical protein
MDAQTLRDLLLMNSDSDEAFFVFELFICKTVGTDHGRAYYAKVRDSARADLRAVLQRSTPSAARAQQLFDMIESAQINIMPFLADPAIETDRQRLEAFVGCRPLLSLFVTAFFDRPTPESAFTLNAYYAAAGPNFFRELVYLYLLRVDVTVRIAIRSALHEAQQHFRPPDNDAAEDMEVCEDESERHRPAKRIKFDPLATVVRSKREYYEIFLRPEGFETESRCPVFDEYAKQVLGKLILAIPFILDRWFDLPVREFVLVYRGISNYSEELNPMTPIGLYVHLQFFTPTHLRKALDACYNLVDENR